MLELKWRDADVGDKHRDWETYLHNWIHSCTQLRCAADVTRLCSGPNALQASRETGIGSAQSSHACHTPLQSSAS